MPRGPARKSFRTSAVTVMAQAHGDVRAASKLFTSLHPSHPISRLDHFLKRWGSAFASRGSVHDKARRGRPTKNIPQSELLKASEILKEGYEKEEEHYFYESLAEAVENEPFLQQLLQKYPMSLRTLWRKLTKEDSDLRTMNPKYKPKLSQATRESRVAASIYILSALNKDTQYLLRVFWLDGKKIWVVPGGSKKVICSHKDYMHGDLVIEDDRIKRGGQSMKIAYYSIVNAIYGPVDIKFVSGTTDYQRYFTKKVRTSYQ